MKIKYLINIAAALSCFVAGGQALWAETAVELQTAGSLSTVLTTTDEAVKISGPINGSDVLFLRSLIDDNKVHSLDLSDASIVSGGSAYYEDYVTDDGVLGKYMFYSCANLQYVKLPASVTSVPERAFSHSGLKKIEIPSNITSLGFDAFAYCKSLDTVIVGRRVVNLAQGAFYSSSVKVAYVKTSSVPSIASYLFSSKPVINVYTDVMADFLDSDWAKFGTITGELEALYPLDVDTVFAIRKQLENYFADYACTQLKSAYTTMDDGQLSAEMKAAGVPDALVAVALKVKNENWAPYEKDFRIHNYKAYSDANYWNKKLNASGGSYMGNPTGIYSDGGLLYVFVGADVPDDATLYFKGCEGNSLITGAKSGVKLSKGLNIVEGTKDALYYVLYTADTRSQTKKLDEWPDIKIHVEGGVVNGYYDVTRHSDSDYLAILNNATHDLFTVKGGEALFNFKTSTYKTVWPESIDKSVVWFDSLTVWEKELMGFCESVANGSRAQAPFCLTGGEAIFPIYYNNPNFAIEGNESDAGYANSSTYRTSYNSVGCIRNSFVVQEGMDDWCAAHECGHNNQGTINLESCTEVSNNLFSNVICHLDGITTTKGYPLSTTMNDYANHVPFFSRDITSKMRMYYQLYLYYHQGQKNTSFYPELFKALREDPLTLWGNADNSALKFVRKVCEVAQEDLTDFFAAWGFFEPCDLTIDDYGTYSLTVTQEDIDQTLAEIAQYPKKNREILFVEDRIDYIPTTSFLTTPGEKRSGSSQVGQCGDLGQFSDFFPEALQVSDYSYTRADSLFAMTGTGGVGFLVLDKEGKMVYAANSLNFCIPSAIGDDFTIYSVDADGAMHEAAKLEGGVEVVHMTDPGTLADSLSNSVIKAVISGPINGSDVKTLRRLIDEEHLQSLDLSEASIVSGGDEYAEGYKTSPGVIGNEMFANYSGLVAIKLPQDISAINKQAFSHSGLKEVTVPDGVTSIGFDAFAYCDQLDQVTIGPAVEKIAQGAFYSSSVKDAYVKAETPPAVGSYLFSSKPVIHVYKKSLDDYLASDWAKFGTIVGDLDDWETLTSVYGVLAGGADAKADDAVYDVSGRRVGALLPFRTYIRNGRKFVFVP